MSTDELEPKYFATTADAVIANGIANVAVEAEVGGTVGNVDAGSIKVVLGDLSGILTVLNTSELIGGTNEETDAELYARFKEKVSRPITSGKKYNYEYWAKEIGGVADARCYPLWNGPGTVKVVVINSEKRAPSAEVIAEVENYIQEQRPVGRGCNCHECFRGANRP